MDCEAFRAKAEDGGQRQTYSGPYGGQHGTLWVEH